MSDKPLYVLDLDRTLIDTDKVVEMLAVSLNMQGYDGDAVIDKIEKARIAEQDIDTKKAIDLLGIDAWESVKRYFFEEAKKTRLVFEDAQTFLENLVSAGLPHIILTFGVSKDWQYLKLKSTGLDRLPAIVSGSREKSTTINSWKSSEGTYVPPGFEMLSAERIILIDDRPGAFTNVSGSLKGYLLDRAGRFEAEYQVPSGVSVIKSLRDIKIDD